MYNVLKKTVALTVLLIASFIFTSCGVWRNFTTYFNTYYNAKTLFDQTETEILKKKTDLFAFRDDQPNNLQNDPYAMRGGQQYGQNAMNQYGNQQYGNQQYGNQQLNNQQQYGNQQYNQYGNQQNQYGNQQYNQYGNQSNQLANQSGTLSSGNTNQDLVKVIEKCSKILQFEKESSYFPDALFITGKAFYYQQEYSKAQRKFIELAGLNNEKYALENKLWLAKTNLQLRNFDDGLKQIEEVKADALKDEDDYWYTEASITKISFLIFREEYTKAVTECQDFLNVIRDDEMNALVAYQLGMIYQKLGDEQNALKSFDEVLNYSPTFEIERKSRLEHARLLKALNRIDESEVELESMSNQGKYKNNLDEIYLELAEIYDQRNELEKAVDYYKIVDSTYVTLQTSGIAAFKLAELYQKKIRDYDSSYKYFKRTASSLAPRSYMDEANVRTKNFDRYFELKKEEKKQSTQILYLKDPATFLRDSIDYDIAYKEYEAENKQQEEALEAAKRAGSSDPQAQQQMYQLQQQQQVQQQQLLLKIKKWKKDEPIPLKLLIQIKQVEKPARPQGSLPSIISNQASNFYNQGSLFYSEFDVADSAYYYFNKALLDTAQSPTRIKTLYSLATYYSTHKDSIKADSLYQLIYEKYPKDELATASAEKLGLIKKRDNKQLAKADEAEAPFLNAEALYYKKEYQPAIDSFKLIYKKYPRSPYAPKAICYAGMIYEENLNNFDSAAVTYKALADSFATNPISRVPIMKYTEYKNEKERLKKEAEEKQKAEEAKKKEEEEKRKAEEASKKQESEKANGEKDKADQPVQQQDKPETEKLKEQIQQSPEKPKNDSVKVADKAVVDSLKVPAKAVKDSSKVPDDEIPFEKRKKTQKIEVKKDTSKVKQKILD